MVYGVYRHFQQYVSYIVEVSFIGQGNWSNLRKPPDFYIGNTWITCKQYTTND